MQDNALMPQQATAIDAAPGVGGARSIIGVANAVGQATGTQTEQGAYLAELSAKIDALQKQLNQLIVGE